MISLPKQGILGLSRGGSVRIILVLYNPLSYDILNHSCLLRLTVLVPTLNPQHDFLSCTVAYGMRIGCVRRLSDHG